MSDLPEYLNLNVPQDWSLKQVENTAYLVQGLLDVFGARVPFEAWWGRFKKDLSRESASRTWDRIKARFRQVEGLEFLCEQEIVNNSSEDFNYVTRQRDTLVFPSASYMQRVVEGLIGPALIDRVEPTGRTLYDFFPGEDPEDVEALMDLLAEDLREERGAEAA